MAPTRKSFAERLPRTGAALGALTGILAGGMLWTTASTPGPSTAAAIAVFTLVLVALGIFGARRIGALAARLGRECE